MSMVYVPKTLFPFRRYLKKQTGFSMVWVIREQKGAFCYMPLPPDITCQGQKLCKPNNCQDSIP